MAFSYFLFPKHISNQPWRHIPSLYRRWTSNGSDAMGKQWGSLLGFRAIFCCGLSAFRC